MATEQLEHKYARLSAGEVDADGTFSGYASLFGVEDLGRDIVEPGAFRRSLDRRGTSNIRMLYQHDPAMPIGRWQTIREDKLGLYVRGRIANDAAKAREVLQLIRDGALDGLSIGFRTIRSRAEAKTGIRRIIEADLWEISVVTFPMLPGARVVTVKSGDTRRSLPTKREMERRLTRDAGLTRGQARAFIAKGYSGLSCARDAAHTTRSGLADVIRRAASSFK